MAQRMVEMTCTCGGCPLTFTGTESTAVRVRDAFVDLHNGPKCQVSDANDPEWSADMAALEVKYRQWKTYMKTLCEKLAELKRAYYDRTAPKEQVEHLWPQLIAMEGAHREACRLSNHPKYKLYRERKQKELDLKLKYKEVFRQWPWGGTTDLQFKLAQSRVESANDDFLRFAQPIWREQAKYYQAGRPIENKASCAKQREKRLAYQKNYYVSHRDEISNKKRARNHQEPNIQEAKPIPSPDPLLRPCQFRSSAGKPCDQPGIPVLGGFCLEHANPPKLKKLALSIPNQ